MPYIKIDERRPFIPYLDALSDRVSKDGEVAFCIYYLLKKWYVAQPKGDYATRKNVAAIGTYTADEFVRRFVTEYEKGKIIENGDV